MGFPTVFYSNHRCTGFALSYGHGTDGRITLLLKAPYLDYITISLIHSFIVYNYRKAIFNSFSLLPQQPLKYFKELHECVVEGLNLQVK